MIWEKLTNALGEYLGVQFQLGDLAITTPEDGDYVIYFINEKSNIRTEIAINTQEYVQCLKTQLQKRERK